MPMTMETITFYVKQGRRYVPVKEYDSRLYDSLGEGVYLVTVKFNSRHVRARVDPNYAAMIAAGQVAQEAIVDRIREGSKLRQPQGSKKPLTPGQARAWRELAREMGEDMYLLEWPSYYEAVDAGIKAMQEEAEHLMQIDSVKQAWEHFQTVARLCHAEKR